MSIFSWFRRGKKPVIPVASDVQTGMSGMESTRPLMPNAQRTSSVPKAPADRHAQRRNERNARRELLYQVVRESMVRAGVLSSGYKFKVLSLDQRGKEFMVMIDLAAEYAGEMDKLAEIETLVARSAKIRHDVQVQALYWRFNTLPAGGIAVTPSHAYEPARSSFSSSRPIPLDALPSMPAPLFSPSQPGSLIETLSSSGHFPLGGGVRPSTYESPGLHLAMQLHIMGLQHAGLFHQLVVLSPYKLTRWKPLKGPWFLAHRVPPSRLPARGHPHPPSV